MSNDPEPAHWWFYHDFDSRGRCRHCHLQEDTLRMVGAQDECSAKWRKEHDAWLRRNPNSGAFQMEDGW